MNQKTIALGSVALLVVAIAIAAIWYGTHPKQTAQVQNASKTVTPVTLAVGAKAPEFQVSTTAGLFDLAEQTKPVFLEVFATWCPHCQRETQVLDRLFATYGSRVAFVAVSGSEMAMDGTSDASQADVVTFAQRFGVKYPIAYDGQMTVFDLYNQGGYPTIVIITKDKRVAYAASGEIAYGDLAAQIDDVLK